MHHSVYFIGAGLTKSLHLPDRPVPLMTDFVRVMADYVDNDVILTTLAELENAGVYEWKCKECSNLARTVVGRNADRSPENRSRFARSLKNRPSESIEDLIERAATIQGGSAASLKDRFLFAINQLFALVGWNLRLGLLESFLRLQLAQQERKHTLVSFNYDLVLDRALQVTSAGSWSPADGYGFPIQYFTTEQPPILPPAGVLRSAQASRFPSDACCTGGIQLLRPHGSLNWLLPLKVPYESDENGLTVESGPMVIPLGTDGCVCYWPSTETFKYIQCPNRTPADYGICIIPPSRAKRSGLGFFEETRTKEVEAVKEGDEFFVIGYSLPPTDVDQESLVRSAAERRSSAIRRLVVVNYGAPPAYYRRIAEIFSFPKEQVEVFNTGFESFVNDLQR